MTTEALRNLCVQNYKDDELYIGAKVKITSLSYDTKCMNNKVGWIVRYIYDDAVCVHFDEFSYGIVGITEVKIV